MKRNPAFREINPENYQYSMNMVYYPIKQNKVDVVVVCIPASRKHATEDVNLDPQ